MMQWEQTTLEKEVYNFLVRKYIQRADERQKARGLQYMETETHDLAAEIAHFIKCREENRRS